MDQEQWDCIWIRMGPVSEVQIDAIHPAYQVGLGDPRKRYLP